MDTGPEKFEIGTPGKSSAQEDDELADGPNTSSERRTELSCSNLSRTSPRIARVFEKKSAQ